jgi:hypothetical protein
LLVYATPLLLSSNPLKERVLKIWLSKSSEVPLREQLATQVILGIVSGDLNARPTWKNRKLDDGTYLKAG